MKPKRLLAMIVSASIFVNMLMSDGWQEKSDVSASSTMIVEYLDRGISAINTGSNRMMVSWRMLASDPADTTFRLYRGNTLIYTSNPGDPTCYLDTGGSATASYRVDSVVGGTVTSSENIASHMRSNTAYFDIPLTPPTATISGVTYSPNDITVGDVDGDGEYELFVKWEPSNSQDNSNAGITDKVYIDCIKLNGTRLWRIDLGINIRAGAHYTQMLVADFDLSGNAKLIVKTAPGSRDAAGNVLGGSNANTDYRNSNGYILSGAEYLSLICGKTGQFLHTIDYKPGRGTVSSWGDNYGNRVDRFLGAVAYLDGIKPSAIMIRGYYTRMTATAYDVVDNKLVEKWAFDTGTSTNTATGYGGGNHNVMPADLVGNGKQQIALGSTAINSDGTLLWAARRGHGDALHVSDFLNNGTIQVYSCWETTPFGVSLLDGKTGSQIWRREGSSDTGRAAAGNTWTGSSGSQFWSSGNNAVMNNSGQTISGLTSMPSTNFLIWWDGGLERQLLDNTGSGNSTAKIEKINTNGSLTRIFTSSGSGTINSTKGNPCLSADIFGDWREELILRGDDNRSLRIYTTPTATTHRITTLMHDPQYRNQVAGQNICYNQPPHPSFYLGTGSPIPASPNVTVNNKGGTIQRAIVTFNPNGGITPTLNATVGDNNRLSSLPAATREGYTFIGWNTAANGSGMTVTTSTTFTIDTIIYAQWTLQDLNGTFIKSLKRLDDANAASWSIQSNLKVGDLVHGDRVNTYTGLHTDLVGAERIVTAVDSRSFTSNVAEFTAGADITVYIGIDDRQTTLPSFLNNEWTKTALTTSGNDATNTSRTINYTIYRRDFASGTKVTLGANGQTSGVMMYTVYVTPTAPSGTPNVIYDMQSDPNLSNIRSNGSSHPIFVGAGGTRTVDTSDKSITITGRTAAGHGLDIKLADLKIKTNHTYKFEISGNLGLTSGVGLRFTSEVGSSTSTRLIDPNPITGSWGSFSFSYTTTYDAIALLLSADSGARFRLRSDSSLADLSITSIIITTYCPAGCTSCVPLSTTAPPVVTTTPPSATTSHLATTTTPAPTTTTVETTTIPPTTTTPSPTTTTVSTTTTSITTTAPPTTTPEITTEPPGQSCDCGECNDCPVIPGHIRSNKTSIGIADALEILIFLAKVDSSMIALGGEDSRPWKAALIANPNGTRPGIGDALQIVMYLAYMPCNLGTRK